MAEALYFYAGKQVQVAQSDSSVIYLYLTEAPTGSQTTWSCTLRCGSTRGLVTNGNTSSVEDQWCTRHAHFGGPATLSGERTSWWGV